LISGILRVFLGDIPRSGSPRVTSVSSGERIYHVPGQRYYDKTQINEGKGERWFCTEQEAVGPGWQKAKV